MENIGIIVEQLRAVALLAGLVVGSGTATSAVTELLKWQVIKAPAERFPRAVAAIISVAISAGVIATIDGTSADNIATLVVFAVAVFVAATQLYDSILKQLYADIR